MIYLFLAMAVLTAVWGGFAFYAPVERHIKPRLKAGFYLLLAMSLAALAATIIDYRGRPLISDYITPYINQERTVYVPPSPGDASRRWLLETKDPPAAVERFYARRDTRKGWDKISGFPYMTLRRDGQELVISVSGHGRRATIEYQLRETP